MPMDDHDVEFDNMTRMSMTYARRHFSEFLDRTESGERIVITRNGNAWAVAVAANDPIRLALSGKRQDAPAPQVEPPPRSPK